MLIGGLSSGEISSSIGVSVNDVYAESSLITVQGAGEAVIQAIYERIPTEE